MLRTMLRGQVGPDVQAIQDALKIRTPGMALLSDGKFGQNTQAAVIDFQKRNQLKPDGIVGPRTRSVLYPLVATTINMVGTKGRDGGALVRLPDFNPRQASLNDFRVPRAPLGIKGSALSPPPGPQLKLDSFQLNPGGQVSFVNLGQSPQASFSLGLQSVFKRGEDDGRLELALGVQLGSPLFLRASDGSAWTFSWFSNFTWVDPLGKAGLFHLWSPFATLGGQGDGKQVSVGAGVFPINLSLDVIPDRLNISVNSGVAGTFGLRDNAFTWGVQTSFGVGGTFTLF
jgi:hypothetical protein